jgi:serine/threonine protein kinase/tetratricopeptide (TPR) repeat protein
VATHAIEETPEHIFIAMEYVEGQSLRSIVKRGEMTWERALELAPQILAALSTAHEHDIVHRDVKSDNILLTPKGQLKVLDFGLARGRDASAYVSRVGSSAGTPAYMSPEQVQDGEVDHRSDLFSFGVVLYEMVTGRMPFKGEHEAAVTYSIVNETPTTVGAHNKAVPDSLQKVIAKLLEKNPRDRYQSAAEVMEDLKRVEAGQRVRAGRGLRTPVVAVAAIALALSTIWFSKARSPADGIVADANAGRKMLAVLPFENLGPTDQEYFADGVTEEITTHLANLSGLGVISRTSAMKYKGSPKGLREIGKELGVDYVLEGSVRWDRSGDQNNVRISTQLIRINDDTHLWAENFDRVYEQIFELQSEIAGKVADELNVTLLAPERAAIAAAPTDNLDAYDLYMRGRASSERALSLDEMDAAMLLVEQAVVLDSTYADAQAFLARRYANQHFNRLHLEKPRLEQARSAALAATRHAGDGPAGHIAMGYYYYYGSRDYARALREFALAEQLQPNNADVLEAIAFVQRRQGRWDESIANLERAIDLDPSDADRIGNLLQTLIYMERWDDAERYVIRGAALDPNSPMIPSYRAFMAVARDGDPKAARQILEPIANQHASILDFTVLCDLLLRDYDQLVQRIPNLNVIAGMDTVSFYTTRASVCHFTGDDSGARVFADSALAFMDARNFATSDDPQKLAVYATVLAMVQREAEALRTIDRAVGIMPVSLDAMSGVDIRNERAIIYVITGDYDRAVSELEYLMSVPSPMSPAILRLHPGFDPLRDNPRFKRIVEEKVSS